MRHESRAIDHGILKFSKMRLFDLTEDDTAWRRIRRPPVRYSSQGLMNISARPRPLIGRSRLRTNKKTRQQRNVLPSEYKTSGPEKFSSPSVQKSRHPIRVHSQARSVPMLPGPSFSQSMKPSRNSIKCSGITNSSSRCRKHGTPARSSPVCVAQNNSRASIANPIANRRSGYQVQDHDHARELLEARGRTIHVRNAG